VSTLLPQRLPIDWALTPLFAAMTSPFGGDVEALEEPDIARLVEQARAGDDDARERLYRQYVDRVFRTVHGLVRSSGDAEDVTQDAMLAVLTSLDRYRPRSDARFASWVMTIAINTARRRFRRRRPELTATGELSDLAGEAVDRDEAMDRARARRVLLVALAELPERDRTLVSLRYGAELNASEIGHIVGLEPATVRKTLERARGRVGERIQQLLRPAGGVA